MKMKIKTTTPAYIKLLDKSTKLGEMEPSNFKVYRTRWYILTIHTLIGLGNITIYSTWGPIEKTAQDALGLTQTDLALLPNWFNLCYFIAVFPFMWLIQTKGLRAAELTTASIICAGAAIRCFSFGSNFPTADRVFIHLGQIVNGIAAPIPWIGCTYISAFWFPVSERSLATSIGLSATYLGEAVAFLLGPLIVQHSAPGDPRMGVQNLLYIELAFVCIILLLAIIYFPSAPPTAPSFTASVARVPFRSSVLRILKSPQVWIIMAVYSISAGFYASWLQILTTFLEPVMKEDEAGWVGFTVAIVGILAPPSLNFIFQKWVTSHPKLLCTCIMTVGTVAFGIVAISAFFIPALFTPTTIWLALITWSGCFTMAEPIWWEMACEAAYPVAESVISGLFTLASCSVSFIYFIIFMFPQLGTDWATWTLLVAEVLILPLFQFYKPIFRRRQKDIENDENRFDLTPSNNYS